MVLSTVAILSKIKTYSSNFQGFSNINLTYGGAVMVLLACERRLGRELSKEELMGGKLKDLLIQEDFNIGAIVSTTTICIL